MPNTENQTELEIQNKGLDAPSLAPNNIDATIGYTVN